MDFTELLSLSPHALLGLALMMLGVALKRSPLPDWLIPFIIMGVGAAVYPLLVSTGSIGYRVVTGFVIGATTVGLHQLKSQISNRNNDSPPPTDTKTP